MARLKRLAAGQAGFAFHEDRISPAEHGLADFPADIPVLRVVADQDVFFDSGSDLVRPEAYRVFDAIAASLKKEPPDVVLFVGGHTDAQGPEEENMALGLARADQVASGLLRRGIYQAAIYRVSFGEHLPVAGNGTARERARNRRVEFLFGARPEALVAEIRRQSGPCLAPGPDGTPGDCRRALQFLVERMTVEKDYAKAIVDLDLRTQSIEKDMTRTSVEKTAERQVVEIERQRIPIKISRDKIVVPLVR
ncbi:hypothetical protein ASG48_17525 [Aurantimonas sp. Leaf443]|nr:hypothetical protein ASG48_17525 [Aurantimonas sp. Leaf443]